MNHPQDAYKASTLTDELPEDSTSKNYLSRRTEEQKPIDTYIATSTSVAFYTAPKDYLWPGHSPAILLNQRETEKVSDFSSSEPDGSG